MGDYISRGDVKKLLWERISLATFMRRGIPNAMKSLSLISEELEKIPAADVRPVVYCVECRYWNRDHVSCEGLARCLTGETGVRFRNEMDFCSRGAKMGGEPNG